MPVMSFERLRRSSSYWTLLKHLRSVSARRMDTFVGGSNGALHAKKSA